MRTTGRTGTLNWTDSGGDAERTLVLVHSLGTASALWMRQMEPFGRVRRVIAVDLPGHGASTADDHEYTLDELGRDVLAVCDDAGVGRFDYCGISIGGQIGLWLALEAPERVVSLVAACTAARIGDADKWSDRIDTVRQHGLESLLDTVVAGWFGPSFAERDPEALRAIETAFTSTDPVGYVGCCAALRDADLRDRVGRITAPTLLVAGSLDASTPVADAEFLHERIPNSSLAVIQDAGHLACLDRPEDFTRAVMDAWAEW